MGPHPVLTVLALALAALGVLGLAAMPWLGSPKQRQRRRRIASAVVGPYDEIWHPTGRQAAIVWAAQQEAVVPKPLPGDPTPPAAAPPVLPCGG